MKACLGVFYALFQQIQEVDLDFPLDLPRIRSGLKIAFSIRIFSRQWLHAERDVIVPHAGMPIRISPHIHSMKPIGCLPLQHDAHMCTKYGGTRMHRARYAGHGYVAVECRWSSQWWMMAWTSFGDGSDTRSSGIRGIRELLTVRSSYCTIVLYSTLAEGKKTKRFRWGLLPWSSPGLPWLRVPVLYCTEVVMLD